MLELLPIEQCLVTFSETMELADDVDDLDDDDDFELLVELTVDGITEWLETPTRHADPSWNDEDDPYWEIGDGD